MAHIGQLAHLLPTACISPSQRIVIQKKVFLCAFYDWFQIIICSSIGIHINLKELTKEPYDVASNYVLDKINRGEYRKCLILKKYDFFFNLLSVVCYFTVNCEALFLFCDVFTIDLTFFALSFYLLLYYKSEGAKTECLCVLYF